MRWWLFMLLALLAQPWWQPALAGEEYDQLLGEFQAAQQSWFKEYARASEETGAEPDLSKLSARPEKEFRPKFLAFAAKHAGKPEAIPALIWVATANDSWQPGSASPEQLEAIKTLTTAHAADTAIAGELSQLRYSSSMLGEAPLTALYERIVATNSDREAKAAAHFNLAFMAYSSAGAGPEADAKRKQAGDTFRKIVADFGGTKAGKSAEGYVFELDHLQIGMKAPDFSGKDVSGAEIKLSSLIGKVVVIDFWGFW